MIFKPNLFLLAVCPGKSNVLLCVILSVFWLKILIYEAYCISRMDYDHVAPGAYEFMYIFKKSMYKHA